MARNETNLEKIMAMLEEILASPDKLNYVIKDVDRNYEKFEFGEVGKSIYNFVWDDFASWYVEISKVDLQGEDEANKLNTKNVLIYTLKAIIKMLHPFCPFITEELYQALPHAEESISISEWPKVNEAFDDEQASLAFDDLCEVITSIRNERAKANKAPSKPIDITISCKDEDALSKLQAAESYLVKFTNAESFVVSKEKNFGENGPVLPISDGELFISFENAIDVDKELEKLNREFLEKYPIDLYIPGCPVHPLTFINAILDFIK